MGQYYKPIALDDSGKIIGWVYSHDIKERCKGYDGKIYTFGTGLKLMEHSWIGNKMMRVVERFLIPGGMWYKKRIVWSGDYADDEPETSVNLYNMCDDDKPVKGKPLSLKDSKKYNLIVNHTKKLFVDKNKNSDHNGWTIHPLSLLTCEGNGRGGGDFNGVDKNNIIGSWARDVISVEFETPENYEEMKFDLVE